MAGMHAQANTVHVSAGVPPAPCSVSLLFIFSLVSQLCLSRGITIPAPLIGGSAGRCNHHPWTRNIEFFPGTWRMEKRRHCLSLMENSMVQLSLTEEILLPHLDLSRAIFTKPNLWTEWLTILGVGLFFVSRKSFVNSSNSLAPSPE